MAALPLQRCPTASRTSKSKLLSAEAVFAVFFFFFCKLLSVLKGAAVQAFTNAPQPMKRKFTRAPWAARFWTIFLGRNYFEVVSYCWLPGGISLKPVRVVLLCIRMYPYVSRMYPFVSRMLIVGILMYPYVPYVTRMLPVFYS